MREHPASPRTAWGKRVGLTPPPRIQHFTPPSRTMPIMLDQMVGDLHFAPPSRTMPIMLDQMVGDFYFAPPSRTMPIMLDQMVGNLEVYNRHAPPSYCCGGFFLI